MQYLAFIVALLIVILFGIWSGWQQRRPHQTKEAKAAKVYPMRKGNRTNLRRIK